MVVTSYPSFVGRANIHRNSHVLHLRSLSIRRLFSAFSRAITERETDNIILKPAQASSKSLQVSFNFKRPTSNVIQLTMYPAPYIPQQPLTIIDTMSAASDYATDHDASSEGTPSPPPGLVTFTGFSPGGKPDLRLDTSSCASKSPVFESALPGIDSEPPTPATNSSPSTESELLTPSSSKPELSPIYTSSASFNVPLYATSSRLHASAQSQDAFHSDSPLSPASLTAPAFTDHSPNQGPNRLRPEPNFRFPSVAPAGAPIARCGVDLSHSGSPPPSASSPRVKITHPYARLYAKNSKEAGAAKRRRMWNHALEKSFFTPQEL